LQSPRELLAAIPDPPRGWLTLRRARRWLAAVALARRHNRNLAAAAPAATFYPMRLGPNAAIAHVLPRLGVRIAPPRTVGALSFAWHTGTWLAASDAARLPADAINRRCVDISKSLIDATWAAVTGYGISVDPLTHAGPLVVKPDMNGVRGGQIVTGPLRSTRRHTVYQRLIDSRAAGRIHTLRPMVLDGRLLVVYTKSRAEPDWFAGPEEVGVVSPQATFSAAEQRALLEFCARIGLDYGELDVLRDNDTGLIYVVDANRTPIRPRGLARADEDAAFGPLAEALGQRLFTSP
jgi:hypothetical protein